MENKQRSRSEALELATDIFGHLAETDSTSEYRKYIHPQMSATGETFDVGVHLEKDVIVAMKTLGLRTDIERIHNLIVAGVTSGGSIYLKVSIPFTEDAPEDGEQPGAAQGDD